MKFSTMLILLVTAVVTVFVILNWDAFIEPTTLSFGFREIEGPLGLVLLGITVVVSALLIGYASHLRRFALIQAGLSAKDLQAQRQLADDAEASRLTELRKYLADEFKKLTEGNSKSRTEVSTRLDALKQDLTALNQTSPGQAQDEG